MNDRRAIFSLIAMGRITPAQAERLLAVANERTEAILALALCVASLFLMQVPRHDLLPEILRFFRSLVPAAAAALNSTQNAVNHMLGGLL